MHTQGIILRRKPFKEHQLLCDGFCESYGRFAAIVSVSRKQASRWHGILQPLRLLDLHLTGQHNLLNLKQAEEQQRFDLKGRALLQATYVNELILRAIPERHPMPELLQPCLTLWQYLMQGDNDPLLMGFEWQLYQAVKHTPMTPIELRQLDSRMGMSSKILIGRFQQSEMEASDWQSLRQLLDLLWQHCLNGKTLHARALLGEQIQIS